MLCLPSPANHLFLPIFCGLATLTKLNTEMRICLTKFGIVTHIFEPLDRYLCWWMIRSSRRYLQLSYQCSITDADTSVLISVIKY